MNHPDRIVLFLLALASLVFALLFARTVFLNRDLPEKARGHGLRLLTYSTFTSPNGPGRAILAEFKRTCDCDVEVSTTTDAGLLVERVRLSQKANPIDVVVGLDQLSMGDAQARLPWRPLDLTGVDWVDSVKPHVTKNFAPIDWAPMTFIYRQGEVKPPTSLNDLTDVRFKNAIALEDPRSSTPGLQFLNWVIGERQQGARNYLEMLKPNIARISPSWSLAYGLFAAGNAHLVFSYVTSLVFHWEIEKDQRYQAASFPTGHPYQVEFVGIPEFCHECMLAEKFVHLLLSKSGQENLARHNFMLPAVNGAELTQAFHDLPRLKLIETPRQKDLQVWQGVFEQ